MDGGQKFTIKRDQYGETDSTLKETKSLSALRNRLIDEEPLFRFFLDGSRRTYKIDDIEINRRIYPIIAGQIGVACCERKSRNDFGNAALENSLVLSLPTVANPHSKNSTEFFAALANKINQTPRLKSTKLAFSKILTYSSAAQEDRKKYEHLGIATIQDEMVDCEKRIVVSLHNRNLLSPSQYLMKDGSIQYTPMKSSEFKELAKYKSYYRRVVGVSKMFNPELCQDRSGKSNADKIARLGVYHRTPAYMYQNDRVGNVSFAIWYVRIRDVQHTESPFAGVLKVEKILITDDEMENGLDSAEVDLITANIINERNPVCYGRDKRWANHLYPVYLTESFIKSKYLSDVYFLNLFLVKQIGKIIATEKVPTTVDEFFFWTNKELIIKPFDVVKVGHIKESVTFGVVEEISHLTDGASFLAGFISSDFGDVHAKSYTARIGMNYVKAKVVANSQNIYTPVLDGAAVSLATENDVKEALGLKDVKNPLPCGYIEMYEAPDNITIPVNFNSHFLIGPEGAHLNISGISGLAAKTSYAMFLLKAIQEQYMAKKSKESVAFVFLNVKGRDLLAIDEPNDDLTEEDLEKYVTLGLGTEPFQQVKYFYPYSKELTTSTHARKDDIKAQMELNKALLYKYVFDSDKESIDLLFSNVDDPNQTMESIVNVIATGQGQFGNINNWNDLRDAIYQNTIAGNKGGDKEITVLSWRKFFRLFRKTLEKTTIFETQVNEAKKETQLREAVMNIEKNDVFVVDIAKLDEETQGFVFGDVMRAIYDLKLGQIEDRREVDIPSKIIIFIDELNKYGSKDVPRHSPILRQILDITERGRSLGIILFAAEQFKSDIHDRVKGNCATHAYGRTNAIEVSKPDYQFVPPVYKSMLTRLKQGEYIVQNPIFRSLLSIKFPKPLYKQYKNG